MGFLADEHDRNDRRASIRRAPESRPVSRLRRRFDRRTLDGDCALEWGLQRGTRMRHEGGRWLGGVAGVFLGVMATGCEIRVRDHGPGIDPEIRRCLFEPFVTTKHRGSGLGLATARRVVEMHSGTLTADSDDAGGAVFVIRLPMDRG